MSAKERKKERRKKAREWLEAFETDANESEWYLRPDDIKMLVVALRHYIRCSSVN